METDETVIHISEYSKLEQKEYKTRHDWMGKIILWELCKTLKIDHTNKWYMHKPESILENEMHKIHWGFEIQTYYQIQTRRPDVELIKKKKEKEKKKMRKDRKT